MNNKEMPILVTGKTPVRPLLSDAPQIQDPLMVKKELQPLYNSEEDKQRLEEARRPKPERMKEPVDVVEYCVQVMIDGMLDGGSHFELVDTMNSLHLERDEAPIRQAIREGHTFMIVAMIKKVPIPIYWAGQEWSTDIHKAHQYSRYESLVYWRSKVYTRYARILQMMLNARAKEK